MFGKKIEVTGNTIDIAKTIVNLCLRLGYKIYPEKLEKMMVIAYGEYLVKTGKRLFESKISISKSGPVIKEVSKLLGNYGEFRELFCDEKLLLSNENFVIRSVIDQFGNNNVLNIDDDLRMRNLMKYKKINNTVSDKDIYIVFKDAPKKEIQTHVLCSASEKGKWIVNECLKRGIKINTYKLEKLLILAYGEYLVKTGKKLFNEKIEVWSIGIGIRQVDKDFISYVMGFNVTFYEYYLKLNAEEKLIEDIIYKYGNMDGYELNANIKLKELSNYKNSDGVVSDEDIRKVFEKYM